MKGLYLTCTTDEPGDWLREQIDARELTYSEFARISGVSRETLYKIFAGRPHRHRGATISRLARALGLDRKLVAAQIDGHRTFVGPAAVRYRRRPRGV